MELTHRHPGPCTPPRLRPAPPPAWAAHPFAGNDFCLFPGTSLAVTLVGGCGSGLLRRLAGPDAVLVPVSAMDAHEADHGRRLKLAIWRDPVERLLATHAAIARGEPNHYFWFLDLYGAPVERFVRFAEFELGKSDTATQQPHVRRQSSTWTPDDVDEIVEFGRLRSRLRAAGVVVPWRERGPRARRPVSSVAGDVRERIRVLYAADEALRPAR